MDGLVFLPCSDALCFRDVQLSFSGIFHCVQCGQYLLFKFILLTARQFNYNVYYLASDKCYKFACYQLIICRRKKGAGVIGQ